MIDAKDDTRLLHLHDTDGRPLSLRESFIIAALGHGKDRPYTQITMDGLGRNLVFNVREPLSAVTGALADITWLKFNPAYFVGISPNNGDTAGTYPHRLVFRAPGELTYITSTPPEDVEKALARLRTLNP